jgi:hypothetical protein
MATILKTDGSTEELVLALGKGSSAANFKALQKAVEGSVQFIGLADGETFAVNEEGGMRMLPVSPLASARLQAVADKVPGMPETVKLRGNVVLLKKGEKVPR